MRILDAIVQPAADLALVDCADSLQGRAVGCEPVSDDRFHKTVSTQRFSQELQCCLLVQTLRHEAFEHLSLVINGAPEAMLKPVDLDENFVEVPPPVTEMTHCLNPAASDLGRKNCPEPDPPEPHRFMRDIDSALVQQVLDIPKRERIADVHYHRQADDLGRSLEVAKNAGIAHPVRLAARPVTGNPIFL